MSRFMLFLFILSLGLVNSAMAEMNVPIQLKLKSPTGVYPTESGLSIKVLILSPGSGCVLREENFSGQTIINGSISLSLGSGSRGVSDPALTLNQVYDNSKIKTGLSCVDATNNIISTGQVYSPATSDERIVRILTTVSGDAILANFNMRATPYAIQAESVGGKVAADIVVNDSTSQMNQTNLNDLLLDVTRFNNLKNIALSGQAVSATTATNFSGVLIGDVSGTQGATSVDRIKGVAVSATAPTIGQVLQYDGINYVPATLAAGGAVTSVAGRTGAVVLTSGDISGLGGAAALNVGTVAGTVTAGDDSRIVNAFNDTQAATSLNTASTIVKRDGSGNVSVANISSINNSTNNIYLYDGANSVRIKAPTGLAGNYILSLPMNVGSNGQVLQTDGSGNLSWVNAAGGGAVTSVAGRTGAVVLTSSDISGLGGAAVLNVGTTAGTVAAGDDSRITGALASSTFNAYVASASCTSSETMYWNSVSSQFLCQGISFPASAVTSVAGKTGAVSLVSADVSGLGNSAGLNVGTSASTVAAGNDSRIVNALQTSSAFSGDVTGTSSAVSVNKIRGVAVSAAVPVNGDVLQYNGAQYVPVAIPAAPVTSVAGKTGAISLVSADVSGLGNSAGLNVGTAASTVAAGNDSRITGALQSSMFDGYVASASCSTSQTMYWNSVSSQFLCQGIAFPADAVTSVAGKTGLVTLTSSDISGLGTAAVLNAGVAAGEVVQLDGAARIPASTLPIEALTTSSTFSGDVTGTSSTLSVDRLKGVNVSAVAPVAGQALVYDGTQWVPSTGFPTFARSAANQTFSVTALANVTSLSFAVAAGVTYKYKFNIMYTSAATTTGLKLGLTYPAVTSASGLANIASGADGTGAYFQGVINSSGDSVMSTSSPAAAATLLAQVEGIIVPSAAGTVQLRAATEVAASNIVILAGSFVEVVVVP